MGKAIWVTLTVAQAEALYCAAQYMLEREPGGDAPDRGTAVALANGRSRLDVTLDAEYGKQAGKLEGKRRAASKGLKVTLTVAQAQALWQAAGYIIEFPEDGDPHESATRNRVLANARSRLDTALGA